MNKKPEKIPKSALSLYVKLYCKRKSGTDTKYYNNMIEATKSWLSLSEKEKRQFANKLEQCKEKFKHRFADYLKNVEPYLKKKPLKRFSDRIQFQETDALNGLPEPNYYEDKADTNKMTNSLVVNLNGNISVTAKDQNCLIESFMETEAPVRQESIAEEEATSDHLPEPIPPSVKSAQELFNIVETMNDQNEKTWKNLSSQEKQRYRNAVLTLKKHYICKYKAYLESLPSKQLFDYYNKIIEPYAGCFFLVCKVK